MTVRRLGLAALALLVSSSAALANGAAEDRIAIEGRLTGEGVECPAFRAADGTLYSLLGELAGFGPGDEICIYGRPVEISFCMQGIPFSVEAIAESCERLDVPSGE